MCLDHMQHKLDSLTLIQWDQNWQSWVWADLSGRDLFYVHFALSDIPWFMQWDCFDYTCPCHNLPEIITSKAIEVALLKGSLVRVAVANRSIISGYWVDATIGKGLPVEIDNIAKAKSSTAYKQVTDVATETEQPGAGTTTNIK